MEKSSEINRMLGAAIRERLEQKEMTQHELAEAVGSTQRSISSYVTGKTQPPLDILKSICSVLEISIDQILMLPIYHYPYRIVKDKDELALLECLQGLSTTNKKEFVRVSKLMRKLMK